VEVRGEYGGATRWWKCWRMYLAVSTRYRRVTDGQTDTTTLPRRSPRLCRASRCKFVRDVDRNSKTASIDAVRQEMTLLLWRQPEMNLNCVCYKASLNLRRVDTLLLASSQHALRFSNDDDDLYQRLRPVEVVITVTSQQAGALCADVFGTCMFAWRSANGGSSSRLPFSTVSLGSSAI